MTDPQNDVKCRDCGALTQHATERCDDCRTLANVVECFDEANPGLYSPALGIYHLPDHGGILTLFADRWVAESDPESDDRPWESLSAFVEASDDYRKSRALRAERDTLAAENARLVAELEKPVASEWRWHSGANTASRYGIDGRKIVSVYEDGRHWCDHANNKAIHEGGKHAADLALIAAGYRLIGGVHPAQGEVQS